MAGLRRKSLLALLVLVASAVSAQPDRSHLRGKSVGELKANFLECEHQASGTLLDHTTAAECSMVAEELRMRGFDNSFEKMLKWWQSNRKDCSETAGCTKDNER